MAMPRCGIADFVHGKTSMKHGGSNYNNFLLMYKFYGEANVWPSNKRTLYYAFKPSTPIEAINPITEAIQQWESVSPFLFEEVRDCEKADIKISFERGDHGDGRPFDGASLSSTNILAHAFPPPDGRLHFDADEHWVKGSVKNSADMKTTALHELGHVLGLAHSSNNRSIMFPIMPFGLVKGLNDDDVKGIRALYGA